VLENKTSTNLKDSRQKYSAVRSAEKRRLLLEAGEPWPVCDCCGVDKIWHSSKQRPAGGRWELLCSMRRRGQTLGTYRHKWSRRQRYHTSGTFEYKDEEKRAEERIQKYIEGTEQNKQYKEKIIRSWQMKLK